jgi:hypothetical protein
LLTSTGEFLVAIFRTVDQGDIAGKCSILIIWTIAVDQVGTIASENTQIRAGKTGCACERQFASATPISAKNIDHSYSCRLNLRDRQGTSKECSASLTADYCAAAKPFELVAWQSTTHSYLFHLTLDDEKAQSKNMGSGGMHR